MGQLKDHLISHTGFKPFQCPHCKKFYRRKEILKNHVAIHSKEPYFQENKDKFEEMLENIKKMKNITGNFDDCDNSTSKSSLSCSTSINEDIKFKSNPNINDNYININDQPTKTKKKYNKKKKLIFIQKKRKNEIKEKYENRMEQININNDLLINFNCLEDDKFKNWPNNFFEIMPAILGLTLKQDNINDENKQIINFENEKFVFKSIPDLTEKDFDFSLNNKNNFLLGYNNCNEENSDIDKNEDCSSRITNLYLQEYEDKRY